MLAGPALVDVRDVPFALGVATRFDLARAAAMADAPDPRWPAARLVHHLSEARPLADVADLVQAAERAAADAARVGPFAEQARLLEIPLGDERLDPIDRLRLLVVAAEARVRAGDDVDAQTHVADALEVAHALGDVDAAGAAVRALARGGGAWYWVPYGQHPVDLLGRIERAAAQAADDGVCARSCWRRSPWASRTGPTPTDRASWQARP